MSFTIDSSHQALFNGDAYAQVKITATKDAKNNTFTVKVDGLRGYSKYGWDFGQRVQMWLATDSKGSNKVNLTDSYVSIPGSGSNSYKGWIPKTGFSTSCSITKTYNGNSDGTCPDVWLYFRDYNPNIKWLSAGVYTSFDVSYKGNIKSKIESDIGTNDRSAPTISFKSTSLTSTSISWTVTSDSTCDKWEYLLDAGGWTSFSTTSGTSASKTLDVTSASHNLRVRAKKSSNNVYSSTIAHTFDCIVPTISEFKVNPRSSTSVSASFKCNYDFQYVIKTPKDFEWPTTWSEACSKDTVITKTISNVPSLSSTYYVKVRRTSNNSLTAIASANCDTRPPEIKYFTITPTSNSTATASFSSSFEYKYRITCPDGTHYPSSGWSISSSSNTKNSVPVKGITGTYKLEVKRSYSDYLTASMSVQHNNDAPVIKRFNIITMDHYTAKATLQVTSANGFKYRLRTANGTYSSWSATQTSSSLIECMFSTGGTSGHCALQVKDANFDALTASKGAYCDCQNPDFIYATLKPQNVSQATLEASSSFECYWELLKSNGEPVVSSVSAEGNKIGPALSIDQLVPVLYNANTEYRLRISRTFCRGLVSEKLVKCDSSMPVLMFDSITTEANVVSVRVLANVACKNWKFVFTDGQGKKKEFFVALESTKVETSFSGLEMGTEYNVEVSATKVSNGVTGYSRYGSALQLTGAVHIQTNEEIKPSAVYIYNGGKWKPCLPYIYTNGEWKLGQ